MFTGFYPVNMADEINLDSPQELKDLVTRTADVVCGGRNWEPYILTGASKDEIPCYYAHGAEKTCDSGQNAQPDERQGHGIFVQIW